MGDQKQSSMTAQKKALSEIQQGRGDCSRPHLVIPCWVARQHCPTPFHQAGDILFEKNTHRVTSHQRIIGAPETNCRAAQTTRRDRCSRWASLRRTYPSRRLIRLTLFFLPLAAWLTSLSSSCSRLNNSLRGTKGS